eukprot:1194084-Pleurochrysis_carterae.AAC.1
MCIRDRIGPNEEGEPEGPNGQNGVSWGGQGSGRRLGRGVLSLRLLQTRKQRNNLGATTA